MKGLEKLVIGEEMEITISDCGVVQGIVESVKGDQLLISVLAVLSKCYPKTTINLGTMRVSKNEIYEINEAKNKIFKPFLVTWYDEDSEREECDIVNGRTGAEAEQAVSEGNNLAEDIESEEVTIIETTTSGAIKVKSIESGDIKIVDKGAF